MIIAVGDFIYDLYRWTTATRICPEAPVPVLVKTEEDLGTPGGVGLVAAQLEEFIGEDNVLDLFGSYSRKERIFADGHLVVRIDKDRESFCPPRVVEKQLINWFKAQKKNIQALIISDYGKGTFIQPMAERIVRAAKILEIPIFVDAKHNWSWYKGADFAFPNQHETVPPKTFKHVIQKLGEKGCKVDGFAVPTQSHAVRDCTGAGDIFLAAFVFKWLEHPDNLIKCASFANQVAGKSVEFLGTHVVTWEELA